MIFDTDILIWCQKGNIKAARMIDETDDRAISILTYMEFLQGARSSHEMKLLKDFLSAAGFSVLPLSENIGHRASIYIDEYAWGHGLRVVDSLIAATAIENHEILVTSNQKHFKMIQNLSLKILIP